MPSRMYANLFLFVPSLPFFFCFFFLLFFSLSSPHHFELDEARRQDQTCAHEKDGRQSEGHVPFLVLSSLQIAMSASRAFSMTFLMSVAFIRVG